MVLGRLGERDAVEKGAEDDRQRGQRNARVPAQRSGTEQRARGDGEGQALGTCFGELHAAERLVARVAPSVCFGQGRYIRQILLTTGLTLHS